MQRLLLRPSEAAEILAISRAKTYGLISQGVLPSVRLGHSTRIPLDALRSWIDEHMALGPTVTGADRRERPSRNAKGTRTPHDAVGD